MRYIVVLVTLLFLAGCGLRDIEIKPTNYRLEPGYALEISESKDDRVLRVQRVEGDSAVITRSILYKKDGALKPYKFRRWSELPSTRLQDIFVESIEKQKMFRATVSSRSYAMADLILESSLENFEEIYEGGKSYVKIKIRFRVIERKSSDILGSVLLESSSRVDAKNKNGVVIAFNMATKKIVEDLIGWLNEQRA